MTADPAGAAVQVNGWGLPTPIIASGLPARKWIGPNSSFCYSDMLEASTGRMRSMKPDIRKVRMGKHNPL
jgi:hypothetical protein